MKTGNFWMFQHVIIEAWKNQMKTECSVIVFHRNGFREPLIIISSHGELSRDEGLNLLHKYYGRWKIEDLFLELKCYFQLEDFKLTTLEGMSRYFIVCIVAHGVLQSKQLALEKKPDSLGFIQFVLKKKRNIKIKKIFPHITLESLKLFYEMVFSPLYDFNSLFRLFLANKST